MRLVPCLFLLSLASGAALAQQAVEAPKIEPGTLAAYSEYDANGDGKVGIDEFVALAPESVKGVARTCDTVADGVLSQEEYDACTGSVVATTAPAPR